MYFMILSESRNSERKRNCGSVEYKSISPRMDSQAQLPRAERRQRETLKTKRSHSCCHLSWKEREVQDADEDDDGSTAESSKASEDTDSNHQSFKDQKEISFCGNIMACGIESKKKAEVMRHFRNSWAQEKHKSKSFDLSWQEESWSRRDETTSQLSIDRKLATDAHQTQQHRSPNFTKPTKESNPKRPLTKQLNLPCGGNYVELASNIPDSRPKPRLGKCLNFQSFDSGFGNRNHHESFRSNSKFPKSAAELESREDQNLGKRSRFFQRRMSRSLDEELGEELRRNLNPKMNLSTPASPGCEEVRERIVSDPSLSNRSQENIREFVFGKIEEESFDETVQTNKYSKAGTRSVGLETGLSGPESHVTGTRFRSAKLTTRNDLDINSSSIRVDHHKSDTHFSCVKKDERTETRFGLSSDWSSNNDHSFSSNDCYSRSGHCFSSKDISSKDGQSFTSKAFTYRNDDSFASRDFTKDGHSFSVKDFSSDNRHSVISTDFSRDDRSSSSRELGSKNGHSKDFTFNYDQSNSSNDVSSINNHSLQPRDTCSKHYGQSLPSKSSCSKVVQTTSPNEVCLNDGHPLSSNDSISKDSFLSLKKDPLTYVSNRKQKILSFANQRNFSCDNNYDRKVALEGEEKRKCSSETGLEQSRLMEKEGYILRERATNYRNSFIARELPSGTGARSTEALNDSDTNRYFTNPKPIRSGFESDKYDTGILGAANIEEQFQPGSTQTLGRRTSSRKRDYLDENELKEYHVDFGLLSDPVDDVFAPIDGILEPVQHYKDTGKECTKSPLSTMRRRGLFDRRSFSYELGTMSNHPGNINQTSNFPLDNVQRVKTSLGEDLVEDVLKKSKSDAAMDRNLLKPSSYLPNGMPRTGSFREITGRTKHTEISIGDGHGLRIVDNTRYIDHCNVSLGSRLQEDKLNLLRRNQRCSMDDDVRRRMVVNRGIQTDVRDLLRPRLVHAARTDACTQTTDGINNQSGSVISVESVTKCRPKKKQEQICAYVDDVSCLSSNIGIREDYTNKIDKGDSMNVNSAANENVPQSEKIRMKSKCPRVNKHGASQQEIDAVLTTQGKTTQTSGSSLAKPSLDSVENYTNTDVVSDGVVTWRRGQTFERDDALAGKFVQWKRTKSSYAGPVHNKFTERRHLVTAQKSLSLDMTTSKSVKAEADALTLFTSFSTLGLDKDTLRVGGNLNTKSPTSEYFDLAVMERTKPGFEFSNAQQTGRNQSVGQRKLLLMHTMKLANSQDSDIGLKVSAMRNTDVSDSSNLSMYENISRKVNLQSISEFLGRMSVDKKRPN